MAQVLPEDWPRRTIIVIQWAATFFRSLLIAAMVALVAGVGELLGLRIGGLALVVGVYGVAGFVLVLVVFAIHDLVEITRCPPRVFSRGLPFLRALARAVVG